MKRKLKKLSLSRETLGNMDTTTLKQVAGATVANSCAACTDTVCSGCCTRTVCSDCCVA